MKEMLKKLFEEKESKPGKDNLDKMAKMEMLEELISMLDEKIGNDYEEGMQKVTVAAPDQESLMKGLEKAQEIVPEVDEEMESEEIDEENENEEEDEEEENKKKKSIY